MGIHEIKASARRQIRERLRSSDPADLRSQSAEIVRHIENHPVWRSAGCVALYSPLPLEVDVWPLVERGIVTKKRVALPRRLPDYDLYELVEVLDAERDCQPGRYGIREPAPGLPAISPNELDIIFVPGLGFDFMGGRLGRGKAYYDRLLHNLAGLRCGVAFSEQIVAEAPVEPHDIKMNCLVTPEGWRDAFAADPGRR